MYEIDKKKSLEVLIKNSLGTKIFRSVFFFINGKSVDIYKKGNLSCAIYVSTLLKIAGLIKDIHATVESTIKDLELSGWYKIDKPRKLSVIVWERHPRDNHFHIGFYWQKNKAVSNVSRLGKPYIHDIMYQNRKIEAIYFHDDLK